MNAAAFPGLDSTVATNLGTVGAQASVDITGYTQTILSNEDASMLSAGTGAVQQSNSVLNYSFLVGRNSSLQDLSERMTKENKKNIDGSKETYIRQGEINEWQAANKLDTLFFFQVLFLYLCVLVIAVFLRQYGLFSNTIVYIIAGLFGLVVLGVLWNRASYTATSRDKRYWNRRFIGLDDAGKGLNAKLKCS